MSQSLFGRKSLISGLFVLSFLTACGTIEPPAVPPSDVTTYPAIVEDGYAETLVTGIYPMSLAETRAWLADGNKIVALMEPTENIAKPIDTVYLTGNWPDVGATRRVELSDGHFVLERVLLNEPDRFEYQIWAMTNSAGRNVDHIHGVQAFEELSDGTTKLNWSYKVQPKSGFMRPFVQRVVNNEITPFLTMAIDNTVELANTEMSDPGTTN